MPTFKTVRKKGKIVWIDKANGIKKIAQGDTIRGQLHGESLYGAIKRPKRNEKNQILFDENRKMILDEEPILVIRKDLVYKKDANSPGFKTLEEIEKAIVDKDLFEKIKLQVEAAPDFKTALEKGVFMLDKKGNKINRIRRIRCKESMKYSTAVKVHTHAFQSEKEYKRFTLAKNGENALCLFYKNEQGKGMNILSIGQVARVKFRNNLQYFDEPFYNKLEIGRGKKQMTIPLYAVLRTGQKVLFFRNSIEELKDLSIADLSRRLFKIYQFESDGRIKFRHHLTAGIDTDLKKIHKEFSSFNLEDNPVFLRLRQANWNFAIDGVDFEMKLDGSIEFKF
jgi:CRISPR-associated endonuclease Csn1